MYHGCPTTPPMVKSLHLGGDTPSHGGMAEWTKAAVLKTAVGVKAHRGFESLSLRSNGEVPEWLIGAAC